ncbi:MAG: hypothetical protein COA78_08510 [Blastopirellula sp.]|nr:MAG: hypothetical protein COA78_08510 [Blastopirellula sp.]
MKFKFRFSLRALMIATTISGLVLVPFAIQMNKAIQQKKAVAWVLEQNGWVIYDSGDMQAPFPTFGPSLTDESPYSDWLTQLLGQDFFEEVHHVDLWGAEDLSQIVAFPELKTISITVILNQIDFDNLNKLKELESISIQNSIGINHHPLELSPLQELKSLKTLELEFKNFSGLGSLSQLQELSLNNCNSDNYSAIKQLKNLRELRIRGRILGDISFTANLENLKSINLYLLEITNIGPLSDLKQLEKVQIYGRKITELPSLKNWQKIYHFDIEHTGVSDITPLADLTNVRDLELNGTKISDLSPLAELHELRRLDVGGTKVTDLTPLYGLKKLEHLSVRNTQVTEFEIQQLQQQLPNCKIYDSIP